MSSNNGSTQLEQMGYKQELKRELGLWGLLAFGICMMFPIAPAAVYGAVTTTSLGHMSLVYLIAVIPMSFTAWSYGQMAGAYPVSGSAYAYTQRAINPHLGFLTGWAVLLNYVLFQVLNYVIIGIFAGALFPNVSFWLIVVIAVALVTIVNLLGIKNLTRVNTALILFMFVGVIYFVISSFGALKGGVGWGFTTLPFYNPATFDMNAVLLGTSIACFSFLGFEAMTTLAEEVHNPARTLSKATLIACFFMAFIFILQAYFAQSVSPDFNSFTDLDSAFFEVCQKAGGQALATFVSVAMIAGALANALDCQTGVSRLLYGMGRDEVIPKKFFAHLSPVRRVPVNNILLMAVLGIIGAALPLETVITIINFGALVGFIMVNLSVIVHYYVKNKQRDLMGTIKYLVLPGLGFLTCLVLLFNLTPEAKWVGIVWLIIGFIYAAITTKGFKKTPATLKMMEDIES
ncbi:MAG: APC family permease [Syntrophomonadaceae bacterium]|nr:APC family permease [Syntrophomonadaceae bacterium]MDD3889863.1 APC family permease [Syntrophomonadaceae bacterium]MDD4549982.1 APC family permease [Syntrophomonadaceae bacterium]